MPRHFLLASAVVVLSSAGGAPVRAADLPPPAAPVWTWDGFYLGAHAGYVWAHDPLERQLTFGPVNLDFGDINSRGALAGVQAGLNRQNGRWLTGLEVDISATPTRGASTLSGTGLTFVGAPGAETLSIVDRIDMLGSGRVRLGYLPRPDLLLYATGGLAWTAGSMSADDNVALFRGGGQITHFESPNWQFGWVAGAGAEMRLANTNWLARLEYLHYDLVGAFSGTQSLTTNGVTTTQGPFGSGPITLDLVRAGLSYKFGGVAASADSGPYAWASSSAPSASAWTSPWNWTGLYVGAHAGYGWARDPIVDFVDLGDGLHGIDGQGGLGGFQAGANWQRGALVGGLEIDLSATRIHGQNGVAGTLVFPGFTDSGNITQGENVRLLGSARARLGYLVSPTTLLYGTGGLAWTALDTTESVLEHVVAPGSPDVSSLTSSSTPIWEFGWVAGFGAEQRIGATNWTARLEYLHYDFGARFNSSLTSTTGGVTTVTPGNSSSDMTVDVVRAGASYLLGGPVGAPAAPLYKARPASASWNGFYLGLHGGGGFGNDPFSASASAPPFPFAQPDVHSAGWLAGGQAGANWQTGRWLAGVEFDISATGIEGSGTSPPLDMGGGTFATHAIDDTFNLLGSARARLGWLPWPNLLVYGSGGLAWAQLTQDTIGDTVAGGTVSHSTNAQEIWRWGWAAGLGAETRIGHSNWLGRIEYLHYDFGKGQDVNGISGGIASAQSEGHLTADVVRAGFSYQLN